MPTLPYLVSPGSLKTALDRIKQAATPDRVTGDFVTTKLQIKGGTGAAIPPYLKKIGFVGSDGQPTQLYREFRNSLTSGRAAAEAVRFGYKPLSSSNEYFYDLSDKDLLSLIVQVTGAEANDKVAKLTLSTLQSLKSYADFDAKSNAIENMPTSGVDFPAKPAPAATQDNSARLGLNLAYTINLNLPATSDQAVFNAIFKSLKEHLLSNENE